MSKYLINEDFFENIDSEEKAYWLGFITADGYVNFRERGRSLEYLVAIDLHIQDKDHLEKLQKLITTKVLKIYKNGAYKKDSDFAERVRLSVYSSKMFHDLAKYNIIPRKTFFIQELPNIPDNLKHHFIRGYFDGDGSVYIGRTKYYSEKIKDYSFCEQLKVDICGTYNFLNSISKFLKIGDEHCITKEHRTKKDTWYLSFYSNKRAKEFFDIMYNDATVFLERKYNKFKEKII